MGGQLQKIPYRRERNVFPRPRHSNPLLDTALLVNRMKRIPAAVCRSVDTERRLTIRVRNFADLDV
jgi:hypothetical protein